MTLISQVIDALTPRESEVDRLEARRRARELAHADGWFAAVLDHHQQIEAAFAGVRDAASLPARQAAHQQLAVLLTGHAVAEEGVLYPALAAIGEQAHADTAYLEQSGAKQAMAILEGLEPMSAEYLEKLEAMREEVAHHVYEEESTWFLELQQKADAATQDRLTLRYAQEFERYVGVPEASTQSAYGGNEIGLREAGGYSGAREGEQRGGLPIAGVEGGVYGGLHDDQATGLHDDQATAGAVPR